MHENDAYSNHHTKKVYDMLTWNTVRDALKGTTLTDVAIQMKLGRSTLYRYIDDAAPVRITMEEMVWLTEHLDMNALPPNIRDNLRNRALDIVSGIEQRQPMKQKPFYSQGL